MFKSWEDVPFTMSEDKVAGFRVFLTAVLFLFFGSAYFIHKEHQS